MRSNLPVTQHERTFSARERLISTTDLHGKITYCNDAFVAISGFAREELLGQPHNLVRHPDMPSAVFAHMWDTLKQGKPWMGLVKNRCKQGDFYWVSAYVTPIYENNQMIGYESVRTLPSQAQKARASVSSVYGTERDYRLGLADYPDDPTNGVGSRRAKSCRRGHQPADLPDCRAVRAQHATGWSGRTDRRGVAAYG